MGRLDEAEEGESSEEEGVLFPRNSQAKGSISGGRTNAELRNIAVNEDERVAYRRGWESEGGARQRERDEVTEDGVSEKMVNTDE